MTAQEVRVKMNSYGQEHKPFLFAVDYEMNNGLFVPNPLEQEEIYWRIHDKGNTPPDLTSKPGSYFHSHPAEETIYALKFDLVQQELNKGNSFLLNLTQATLVETDYSFEEIFLRSNAPFNLLVPGKMVCFSPEIFIRIEGRRISSYPMKGTINADLPQAEQTILNDYKESAEHFTIVDFIRSDLSRVATKVKVDRLRYADRLHTMHGNILQISSEISGELPAHWNTSVGDLLFKLLPAGSISGAPKESSVRIIREAEKEDRGYYSGVFGYFDGERLHSAVMIRFIENRNGKLYFHSGGGITINSNMHSEYDEVIEKVYLPFINN